MIDILGQIKVEPPMNLALDAEGGNIHIIPDLHGSRPLLRCALQHIENFPLAKNDKIVIMGNFIGTEGNSKDLIQLLRFYEAVRKEQVVVLRGQNEHEMLLTKKKFLANDGLKIINQYRKHPGVSGPLHNEIDFNALYSDMEWIGQKAPFHISENHIFVHSGIAPSVAVGKQDTQTCIYIQKKFHKFQGMFLIKDILGSNKTVKVVHTNTADKFASSKPKFLLNRIDVGTVVDPGKEISVITIGDSGKNLNKAAEVFRIWTKR